MAAIKESASLDVVDNNPVPHSPITEKDFIYVEEDIDVSDGSRNGDRKSEDSVTLMDKKSRRSSGSSFADVHMADFEPKMEKTSSGHDVMKLVREAQMDDIHDNYFSEPEPADIIRRGSAPVFSETDSTSGEEEGIELKRTMSESAYAKDACILFHGVTYLGSSTVNAPVSEIELRRTISILRDHTEVSISIILAIGLVPNGDIRLIDPESRTDIASYSIANICFWGRGDSENREKNCFAFNISHGADEPSFHCHVFQCQADDAVTKVLQSISQTLKKDKKRKQLAFPSLRGFGLDPNNLSFKFDITLDIWEEDGHGSYQQASRDRSHFKLREGLQRKVVLIIDQLTNKKLHMERCFGLLLASGKDVPNQDMHLLEYVQMDPRPGGRVVISGHWNPTLAQWKLLNTISAKDARAFFTVAADIIFQEVKEPIRIIREFRLKVFPSSEKFWNVTKPRVSEGYTLELKENFTENGEKYFEMASLLSNTDLSKQKAASQQTSSLSALWRKKKAKSFDGSSEGSDDSALQEIEAEDEDDEPLLSGSGVVEREWSQQVLLNWADIMLKYKGKESERPKQLIQLVREGVPEPLRGQIWQMLVGLDETEDTELLNSFPDLVQKESAQEQVILWDITRTFPAHDYFKDAGGDGQTGLYRISKAYSSYDEEVGYCQGMSFLIAVLLLHMPEEQAFGVLVKIMEDYGHRELFNNHFDNLHQSFYVLERIMEDYMADLYHHFQAINIEVHMFASQWFLTLFTAKFPLGLVFQIMDILLCEGFDVMFQIAMAFLKESKKDLLLQDFEGVLKYFRVNLPKKYMEEEQMKNLINAAFSFKISKKRLAKYKREYAEWKQEMQWKEDPLSRFQRENQLLMEQNMRLDHENGNLAHELVASQFVMMAKITEVEERVNLITKDNEKMRQHLIESEEEINRLKAEEIKIKEMWRQATEAADTEKNRKDRIIEDYKQILSRMEERSEQIKQDMEVKIKRLKGTVLNCANCSEAYQKSAARGSDDPSNVDSDERSGSVSNSEATVDDELLDDESKMEQLRDLEAELIQTKMALAEEKHRSDELEMRLQSMTLAAEKPWYKKVAMSSKR